MFHHLKYCLIGVLMALPSLCGLALAEAGSPERFEDSRSDMDNRFYNP